MPSSTFGRRAVNDGKLTARLRNGGRITTDTLERIHGFHGRHPPQGRVQSSSSARAEPRLHAIRRRSRRHGTAQAAATRSAISASSTTGRNICCSSTPAARSGMVANRVAQELAHLHPRPPAVRVFDAGVGDGTRADARHARDARPLSAHAVLRRRQGDQPRGRAADAAKDGRPLLRASGDGARAHQPALRRCAVARGQVADRRHRAWSGTSCRSPAIRRIDSSSRSPSSSRSSAQNWKAGVSAKTGNPIYERPVVLVIYREDHRFLLDPIIPRPRRHARQLRPRHRLAALSRARARSSSRPSGSSRRSRARSVPADG